MMKNNQFRNEAAPATGGLFTKIAILAAVLSPLAAMQAQETLIPEGSGIADAPAELQRLLLSPLDIGAVTNKGAYKLRATEVSAYEDIAPKAGQHVLKFSGEADSGGAKGDYSIAINARGELRALGVWVYLTPESNAREVGFQIHDAEGEALKAEVAADWDGWQWVEMDLDDETFAPAYRQPEKNGALDLPIKGVNIIWFASEGGPTSVGVDALAATSALAETAEPYHIESISPVWNDPGESFAGTLLVHNFLDRAQEFQVTTSLQVNSQYQTPRLPDPVFGSDHAEGRSSWLEMHGERIDNGSLTDGDPETALKPAMPKEGISEILHTVDLETPRRVLALEAKPGDGNWIRKIDILASDDGARFTPVEGLQNIDLEKLWSFRRIEVPAPFSARYLRVRYHDAGEDLPGHFRTLASLRVYDGTDDETIDIPSVGEVVASQESTIEVPARTFRLVRLEPTPPLGSNAYLFGTMVHDQGLKKITLADYFVMPEGSVDIRPESRFGINVNSLRYVSEIVRAGFGWVRFENMKWQFYNNPGPEDFHFDGTVAPWHVPMDTYFKGYKEAGLSILPYIFETPEWATSAPDDIKKNRKRYPPEDLNDYGTAIFQGVARYGSEEVSEEKLRTNDKRSGLDYIHTYEIWNEPNLTAPAWGFFIGPIEEYYDLFRVGVEALKTADPGAKATNGGWAGLSMEWIDTMRTHEYPDGKTPLDFTDVLNVHYYTGKQEPEHATDDPNANRTGQTSPGGITLEDRMINLADWRDQHKPDMPIWITETGYDVGGPIGRTERHQAAKLPRGALMALANGLDKVMIYRIAGSTPTHHGGAGLIRNDGSLRPSYFTMATLIRQLDGVTDQRSPRLRTDDPRLWLYLWTLPDGPVLTAHAPEGDAPAPLGLDLGQCLVTNAFGGQTEMEVTKDFQVGEFPVYISRISNRDVIDRLRADAVRREVSRRKEIAFLSEAEAYLIDFGSHEDVGVKRVGSIRTFDTAVKEDTYDPEKGYGFVGDVSGKKINAGWIRSLLDKDAIQLHRPAQFRIDAEPGVYEFQLKAHKYRNDAELILTGAREGTINVPLPLDDDQSPTPPVQVTLTAGQPLEIQLPAATVQWLTLVPVFVE